MAQMDLCTEKKIMDMEKRLVAKRRVSDWESEVNRCKLLLLEWICNGILLYSTGNYVLSLVMEHDNVRKKNLYIYV